MTVPTVIPRGLRKGDTIGLVSPSLRFNETYAPALARGVKALEALGFGVKVFWTPTPAAGGRLTVAQGIAHRIQELTAAFADPEVHGIMCTIGGMTASELVPWLTRDEGLLAAVRANPKVLVGYSDVTVLHWALGAAAGLRTYYGPAALSEMSCPPAPLAFTVDHLLRTVCSPATVLGPIPRSTEYALTLADFLLSGDAASEVPQALAPSPAWKWLRGGAAAEGPLFGGCLPVVVRMMGVPALRPASWDGKIVFLETALAEGTMRAGYTVPNIRRSLADLVAHGVFDNPAAVVLGRFLYHDTPEQIAAVEEAVREVLCPESEPDRAETLGGLPERPLFPILMHVDFGHTSPMVTLPMGALARVDPANDEFSILEAGVRD